jgi:hypothetical protein
LPEDGTAKMTTNSDATRVCIKAKIFPRTR